VLVLAVESATDTAAVALADEDGPLGSLLVARGRRHTETLAPAIDALCRRLGVALADLDLIAVDVGPGLFTGLRVGLATAKALAFALGLPVATATSLEVLAHALVGSGAPEGSLLVPVVDARRSEVFSARFRAGPSGLVETAPPALWSPGALASDLASLTEPLLLAGDGARRYHADFGSLPAATLAGSAYGAPPVAALAELALARGLSGLVHRADRILPLYLRPADARINWDQRLPPRAAAAAGA
jgi:tRNA threonylcarbamoyladenosine biosynthesis protein TsaB